MSERRKYKIIVSDRAKQMLGVHIRFLAQVDKDAARNKKKELTEAMRSLAYSPNRFPFLMWITFQTVEKSIIGSSVELVGVLLQLKCDMIATYLKMQRCIAGGEHLCIFYGYLAIQLKQYERIIRGIGGSR